jgi:hypothetical protein
MKLLLIALVAVFTASLGATALAHPADSSSDRVLHKSGFAVSPASNAETADVTPTKPVVLHRSGVVVPGSSKFEYQQALAATDPASGTQPGPATSSDGLSALAIVLLGVGGVGAPVRREVPRCTPPAPPPVRVGTPRDPTLALPVNVQARSPALSTRSPELGDAR